MTEAVKSFKNLLGDDIDAALQGPTGTRKLFGVLQPWIIRVNLVAGAAGYDVPNVVNFDGEPRFFKGQVPSSKGNVYNFIMNLAQQTQEGETYHRHKSILTSNKTYIREVYPSFLKLLGGVDGVRNSIEAHIPACVEEIPTGRTYPRRNDEGEEIKVSEMTWRLVEVYPSVEAMHQAAEEFYSQFSSEGDGGGLTGIPADFPVPEAWKTAPDEWVAQLPSVLSALSDLGGETPLAPHFASVASQNGVALADIQWVWENRETLPSPF
jgi:hypothetical protein